MLCSAFALLPYEHKPLSSWVIVAGFEPAAFRLGEEFFCELLVAHQRFKYAEQHNGKPQRGVTEHFELPEKFRSSVSLPVNFVLVLCNSEYDT